jgi:hypothetical protein
MVVILKKKNWYTHLDILVEETSVLCEHFFFVKKWQLINQLKWQVKYADFLISMHRQCISVLLLPPQSYQQGLHW